MYSKKNHPMPAKMYRELKKVHDFVIGVIADCNGGEEYPEVNARIREENATLIYKGHKFKSLEMLIAWRDAHNKNRIQDAMDYYAEIAAKFKDAPDYYAMVRYIQHGQTGTEID